MNVTIIIVNKLKKFFKSVEKDGIKITIIKLVAFF